MTTPYPSNLPSGTVSKQQAITDVFAGLPGDSAQLVAVVQRSVQSAAPITPVHVAGSEYDPYAQMLPFSDSRVWMLMKNFIQLSVVAVVILFVVRGGNDPATSLVAVLSSLALLVVVVLSDRERFGDRDPSLPIVEIVHRELPVTVGQVETRAPLVPLIEQMHSSMPEKVQVT